MDLKIDSLEAHIAPATTYNHAPTTTHHCCIEALSAAQPAPPPSMAMNTAAQYSPGPLSPPSCPEMSNGSWHMGVVGGSQMYHNYYCVDKRPECVEERPECVEKRPAWRRTMCKIRLTNNMVNDIFPHTLLHFHPSALSSPLTNHAPPDPPPIEP